MLFLFAAVAVARPACLVQFIADKTVIRCVTVKTCMNAIPEGGNVDLDRRDPASGMATDAVRAEPARCKGIHMEIRGRLPDCDSVIKPEVF